MRAVGQGLKNDKSRWSLPGLMAAGAMFLPPAASLAQELPGISRHAVLRATAVAGTDAYVDVPEMFDMVHAEASKLAEYGFPPRPDRDRSPSAYRSWRQAVEGIKRIEPVLQPVAIFHGPRRNSLIPSSTANAAAVSSNWSGYVVAAPAFFFGPQSITDVFGDWIVPVAQPAFGACTYKTTDLAVYSSAWVGIDGSGSGDVLQAGTESDATCAQGQIGTYQGAWYEWYPWNEVRVTNIPVTPGSAIYVHVWASSATRGHAYIANKTDHKSISIGFSAPPGTNLVGNSAEWVVERPMVDGSLASLTNYVQVLLAGAQASDAQGHSYFPGLVQTLLQPSPLQIQMANDQNQIISVPTLIGQDAIWFMDQGVAQNTPKN